MSRSQAPTIGLDVTAAVTQGGGIGRYTRELVWAMAERTDTYTYRFFSARPPAQLPVPSPIPRAEHIVYRKAPFSARWLYRLWYRLRLPLPVQLFTGRVDLFHSPDFVLPPVFGRIPTLLTVHDLSFYYYPETFTPALVNYLNRVVPWSVRRATHVVADSKATKRDLIELWDVAPAKVTVLYSGVHPRFEPVTDDTQLSAVREKYDLGREPYVLSVSTVQPRKNFQMLIRAFKPLAAEVSHNLVIAGGKGWLSEQVLAEVERQSLAGRVRFLGFVADEDLPALYSGASLFVFPSLYEGFGLPLLEAMGCGVPVLTSDASSLPEVAGEAAYQLSPHDEVGWTEALARLLGDDALRARMVAAGFRQARRFSWSRAAVQLERIYAELLA
ncbi:MAG TPA: glycosyltransferase family 1 protein [Candidatus Sulfomarinibacteraceae bacterium]|nr:glycosyltransferase family 1 protein [Candidatus Sulfomarinibacteraceae bacterium]